MLDVPVLIISFNRPDLTEKILNQVRLVKPKKLYFAVDGERSIHDHDKVEQVKKLVNTINWKCEVIKKFSKVNLGCKYGPVEAMNWFFDNEEMGIILEDDVLVNESFFYFTAELLKKYKDNQKVGSISGSNFQFGENNNGFSYYFSKYNHTWGWATWKRVWNKYDVEIRYWPKNKNILKRIFDNKIDRLYWRLIFDSVFNKEMNTAWDYQWNYMMWTCNLLGIIPNTNLVNNIGIARADSTHTKRKSKFDKITIYPMKFPLSHPTKIECNTLADIKIQKQNYILWKEIVMNLVRKIQFVQSKIFSHK